MKRFWYRWAGALIFSIVFSFLLVEVLIQVHRDAIRSQILVGILTGTSIEPQSIPEDVAEFALPVSFNRVTEARFDDNKDGRYDSWGTTMRKGSAFEATYTADDANADGEPDSLTLATKDFGILYNFRGFPDSPEPRQQFVALRDQREHEADSNRSSNYFYYDLNFDGKIDMMLTKPSDELELLMGRTWTKVIKTDEHRTPTDGLVIATDSGEHLLVIFNSSTGIWEKRNSEAAKLP